MDKVAGKKLRQALVDAGLPEGLRRELDVSLRSVRAAQQKAQKQFVHLRNSTIAHRDPDAIEQYWAITTLDEEAVLKVASEFYLGTQHFLGLLPRVVQQVGGVAGLLNQISAQARRGG